MPAASSLPAGQEKTSFDYTMSLINGKYMMVILYQLAGEKQVMRFNELKRRIGTIPFKTLSDTLKKMEEDGLILRKEYPQIPPKVEYRLSERGKSLLPILDMMRDWGMVHKPR